MRNGIIQEEGAMFSLLKSNLDNLTWKAEKGRNFGLISAAGELGKLIIGGFCTGAATLETAHGRWTFRREGFVHPQVAIRREGAETLLAIFHLSASGSGRVQLGGVEYEFGRQGWWHPTYEFTQGGETLMRFETKDGELRAEVARAGADAEVLSLLLGLGCYAQALAADDATAVALIAAVV
jgi:hypothetical protein